MRIKIHKKSKLMFVGIIVVWVICWLGLLAIVSHEEVSKKHKQNAKFQAQAEKQTDISFARIDIKNVGPDGNDVEILKLSDDKAKVESPAWMHKDGNGRVITSKKGDLSFKVKFKGDGKLDLNLRGTDLRDKNGTRVPVWVEYKSFLVGGKTVLDAPKPVWHDAPVRYSESVKDGQVLDVHVKWNQNTIGKKKPATVKQANAPKPAAPRKEGEVDFAIVDVKNSGAASNDIELLELSDSSATVEAPAWMHKDGNGRVIRGKKGKLSFKVKAKGDGKLQIDLRSADLRNAQGGKTPVWISYTKFSVDGKAVFDTPRLIGHDKPARYSMDVKDGQVALVQVEWVPDSVRIGSGMEQAISTDDASDAEARRKKIRSLTAELKKVNAEKDDMSKKLASAKATNKRLKGKLHDIRSNWWYRVFRRLRLVN